MAAFLSGLFGSGANALLGSKLGGLNADVAMKGVGNILERSGDVMVKAADFFGITPNQERMLTYVSEQAEAVDLLSLTEELINSPIRFGTVWKQLNDSDWEEFCVPDDPTLDISAYAPVLDAAAAHPRFARALQAAAESRFPKLYLLRSIALGITATDEDWLLRAKINTFRTFFLRMALPGDTYDKYINYYVIITSTKDAWDEMRQGQNGKLGFVIDSVSTLSSVKVGSYFETRFEDLLGDKFRELTAEQA